MKSLFYVILTVALLVGIATYAYPADTIKACTQADGTILYTNDAKATCPIITLPKIGIVHPHNYGSVPVTPEITRDVPPLHDPALHGTEFKLADSNETTSVCKLYHQWIALQLRTHGGFEHNHVEDTQQRFGYTTIFGSGYPPAGC
jgi:hypothetical protein